MRHHLLVVSEKKKLILPLHKVKYYRWRHNIFLRTTYIYNKGLLSSILWELCSVQMTPDAGRQTPDNGRRTMDAGPQAPYYNLTGELKIVY